MEYLPVGRGRLVNPELVERLRNELGYPTRTKVHAILEECEATDDDVEFVLVKLDSAQRQPDGSIKEGWVRAVLRSAIQRRHR
jgi:hypothetical protein